MPLTVDYYVSMNSPWTYLAGARFLELRDRYGFTVRTKPAKFGEIFAETGGLPLPKRAPERQAYRMMELKRWRDALEIPIVLEPQHFPSDETAGARLVIAAQDQGRDAARLTMEIGRELWERETNIAETSVLTTAAKRAGIDYDAVMNGADDDKVLDAKWSANTTEAISRGVFGAPSFVFEDGEIFWGQDRLELFERAVKQRLSA
jgi:2-hydroxychromene-2-carboxylate isomerase